MSLKTAFIITTYNNPRLLNFCLKSLEYQSDQDFTLWIADDGSTEETRVVINSYRGRFKNEIHHEWHQDLGYRKSLINNQVFRKLKDYDLAILVDHDVILNQHFVKDHKSQHYERYQMFMGRRVDLSQKISSSFAIEDVKHWSKGMPLKYFSDFILGESTGFSRSFRVPCVGVRKLLSRDRVEDLLGSNFSISIPLLFEINGYNEEYLSYWGEDGDLFVRAKNFGAHISGDRSIAIQYHFDHKRLEPSIEHQERYNQILKDLTYKKCKKGIYTDLPMP